MKNKILTDYANGDMLPNIYVSDISDITGSLGTRYIVEAEGLPTTAGAGETLELKIIVAPTDSASSTISTSTMTNFSTTTVLESPVTSKVQVLNVSSVAGRMTVKLAEAEYIVLSASNSQQRYSSSAVYCLEDWESKQAALSVRYTRFCVYNYFYSISVAEVQL